MMWNQKVHEDSIPNSLDTEERGMLKILMKLQAQLAGQTEEYNERFGHSPDFDIVTSWSERGLPQVEVTFCDFYTREDE